MALLVDPERAAPTLAPSGPPMIGLPGRICPRPYGEVGDDVGDDVSDDDDDQASWRRRPYDHRESEWRAALSHQPSKITENHADERVAKKKYV